MTIIRTACALAIAIFTAMGMTGIAAVAANPSDDVSKTAPTTASGPAHAAASGDPLLEALLTELDRSKSQLRMDQVDPPYYIEYRVNDIDDYSAEAAFGALRENQRVRYRVIRVVVRIGDYKQDSYYGIAWVKLIFSRSTMTPSRCAIKSGWPPTTPTKKQWRR